VSKPTTATQFAEFFQWHAILPTDLHEALQEAARKEGWVPPWDREDQEVQKRQAGKRSAAVRQGFAWMRRSLVREANARQKPAFRHHPSSEYSIDDLHKKYLQLLAPDAKNLGLLVSIMLAQLSENDRKKLRNVKRETLKKDLRLLGIKSSPRKQQSRYRTPFHTETLPRVRNKSFPPSRTPSAGFQPGDFFHGTCSKRKSARRAVNPD
jgi:hypothetical protein